MIKRLMNILMVLCLTIGVLLNGTAISAEEPITLTGNWFVPNDKDPASTRLATGEITAASGEYNTETGQWVFSDAIPTGVDESATVSISKPEGNDSEPSGFKVKEGSGTQDAPYTFELVYPEVATYTVTITGGANATATGGEVTQIELTGEMEAITFTANEGFHFEAYEGETVNGITATSNDGVITVSGAPEKNVNITIPDAVRDAQEVDTDTSADSEDDTKNTLLKRAVIEATTPVTEYDLWVGGEQVTSLNKNNVLEDGGSVAYDPENNKLTLKNKYYRQCPRFPSMETICRMISLYITPR